MASVYDFIIVGGGIAGCTLASQLHKHLPQQSIALIEAGLDVNSHPRATDIPNAAPLVGSESDWKYSTSPQRHLNGRVCPNNAGKALGGGSVINACEALVTFRSCDRWLILYLRGGWIRGDASDYDLWASLVKDPRWSYHGFLPYFRRVENYHTREVDHAEHGFEGPVRTQSVSSTHRDYPLRDPLKAAWASAGVVYTADANSGHPQGLGELVENRADGARQPTSSIYSLAGVEVMLDTLVHRVLLEKRGDAQRASGVQLSNGEVIKANREVILSAGAFRTPQTLLLSGIGPTDELTAHGITAVIDAPYVGKNLIDHFLLAQWWKLRHPQAGLALGSPGFMKPAYAKGTPLDWVVTQSVPQEGLKGALANDGDTVEESHPLLTPTRSFVESLVGYAGTNESSPTIPMDGGHITSTVIGLLPTSRGSVTLASADPNASPCIDPNYNATEVDRYVMRSGLRQMMQVLLETNEGRALIEGETVGQGYSPLTFASSDEQLDEHIRAFGE
ncbi:MAG: hypothetical protein Q9196_006741 [Gyalolechia fulgens]